MPYKELAPLFLMLRSAGYQECLHPRITSMGKCMDCGAESYHSKWVGGHFEYRRLPLQYEVP